MDGLSPSVVSLTAALAAMLVVGVLVIAGRNVQPTKTGWRHIRPSAMHWTGFGLCGGLAFFMAYVWLFVGSSRPDGAEQMRILFWLTLFFACGSALMGWAILQVRKAGLHWRGSVIAFHGPQGGLAKYDFASVVSVRKDWLGRAEILFEDGLSANLDVYAAGAEQLLDAMDGVLAV